jgi:hypothetical protein
MNVSVCIGGDVSVDVFVWLLHIMLLLITDVLLLLERGCLGEVRA